MSRATVLIVADDEDVRGGLGRSLRKTHYRLLFADRPETALQVLASEAVDVVLSDYMMPGMTGLAFLKKVRDRYPDTVRIMLTGRANAELAMKLIGEGEIYRLLTKPVQRLELQVALHLACERLELERENRRLLALVRLHPELLRQLEEEGGRRRAGLGTA